MSEEGDGPQAVLFACAANAVRSPMAAAILQHLMGDRVRVQSAGVRAGQPDPYAIAVLNEIGIDISEHEPADLGSIEGEVFDLVVTLSPEAHHHGVELTRIMPAEVEYWPTPDASAAAEGTSREELLERYRGVRDMLFQRIKKRFVKRRGGPTV